MDNKQDEVLPLDGEITPLQLQQRCSLLPDVPDVVRDLSHYPILTTNEGILPTKDNLRTIREFDANGYVVGVGAGTIFDMLRMFPPGREPKGIIGTDVIPEVVLAGRMLVELLKANGIPQAFLDALGNVDQAVIAQMIQKEPSAVIRGKFEESADFVLAGLHQAKEIYDFPREDFEDGKGRHPRDGMLSQDLINAFMGRFDTLKTLADQDKIAFVLQDVTNPNFVRQVTSLQGYKKARNVIYLSNAVDHITEREAADDKFLALEVAQNTLQTRRKNNLYVFASQRDPLRYLGTYPLKLSQTPPTKQQYFGSPKH